MDPNKQMIRILNWNANSIRAKVHELHDILIEKGIEIATLQETKLRTECLTPTHPEYYMYRNDRITNHAAGGVAIMIKRNIKHKILPALKLKLKLK